MSQIPEGAVIVGVSTRSGSPAALAWGERYAADNELPLAAVMVYAQPRPPTTSGGRPPAVSKTAPDDASDIAMDKLSGFVEQTLGVRHDATLGLLRGSPAQALRKLSNHAHLIVLGSPRETTLSAQRVAGRLVQDAECPILVMPPVGGLPDGKVRSTGKKIARATAEAAARSGRPGVRPRRSP